MKKNFTIVLLIFVLTNSFGQHQKKVMVFLSPEFSATLQDGTKPNNDWGLGFGIDAIFTNQSKISLITNITDDFIFLDDKVFRTYNGVEMKPITNVLNVFAGINYNPVKSLYVSFAAGPSFINGQALLGVKPSIGIYFSSTRRWMAKFSYTNIFDRNSGIKENYSALSFSLGVRLF